MELFAPNFNLKTPVDDSNTPNQANDSDNKQTQSDDDKSLDQSSQEALDKEITPVVESKSGLFEPYFKLKAAIFAPFDKLKAVVFAPIDALKSILFEPFDDLKSAVLEPFDDLKTAVLASVTAILAGAIAFAANKELNIDNDNDDDDNDDSDDGLEFKEREPFSEKLLLRNALILRYTVPQVYPKDFETVEKLIITSHTSKSPIIIAVDELLDKVEQTIEVDGKQRLLTDYEKTGFVIDEIYRIKDKNKAKNQLGIHIANINYDDLKHYLKLGLTSIELKLPKLETKKEIKVYKKLCKIAEKNDILFDYVENISQLDTIDVAKHKMLKKRKISTIMLEIDDATNQNHEKIKTIAKEIRKVNLFVNITLKGGTNFNEEQFNELRKYIVVKTEIESDDEILTFEDKYIQKLKEYKANGNGTDILDFSNSIDRLINNMAVTSKYCRVIYKKFFRYLK